MVDRQRDGHVQRPRGQGGALCVGGTGAEEDARDVVGEVSRGRTSHAGSDTALALNVLPGMVRE